MLYDSIRPNSDSRDAGDVITICKTSAPKLLDEALPGQFTVLVRQRLSLMELVPFFFQVSYVIPACETNGGWEGQLISSLGDKDLVLQASEKTFLRLLSRGCKPLFLQALKRAECNIPYY